MPDYGFISQPQVPDSFKRIGEVINFARGATELQKARATQQADIERAQAESSSSVTAADLARQTLAPKVTQAQEAATQATTKTAGDQFRLKGEYLTKARDISRGLVSDPDVIAGNADAIIPKIAQARQAMIDYGIPPATAEAQASHLIAETVKNPKGIRQLLLNSINADVGAAGTAGNIQEGGVPVTNQQQTSVIATRPLAATPVGQPISGTPQQQQLPPTTPSFDPATNAPGYLGPQPAGSWEAKGPMRMSEMPPEQQAAARAIVKDGGTATFEGPRKIQSGPALGAATTEEGKAKLVNDHFAESAANTASSSLLEGIAQNIKTYGARAIVGTEQEKLSFLNGLLEKIGIPGASDLKTATDLMEKNMAQLAKNSPAATDAARVVNQLASPHPTMNAAAIADAADQIIGQVRMARDVYKTFLPLRLKSDNAEYLKKLGEFADVSDARVWQFEALGPSERAAMVAQMKPEDRETFKKKIEKAEKMGFFK